MLAHWGDLVRSPIGSDFWFNDFVDTVKWYTGAVVAVELHPDDEGDTTALSKTLTAASR